MNHDTDADSGEAPDAADRPVGQSRRAKPLPAPRSPNVPPALGGPVPTVEQPEERVPETEVSVSPAHLYVTVELPGATQDAIELEATDRTLIVRAPRPRGSIYRVVVELPVRVRAESAKATFRNGVLDVTLVRSGGDRDGR